MKTDNLYDLLTGKCIRKIQFVGAPKNSIYLTFDDGPTSHCTPQLLDLLFKHNVRATFFLIGNKVPNLKNLTERILSEGHSIGNHTIDHDTTRYFSNSNKVSEWIKTSIDFFERELNIKPIGFRSPAGIKTPSLNKILQEMHLPLILWDVRFYDTSLGLEHKSVTKKLSKISDGSIILLHDTHSGKKLSEFLTSVEYLIIECKKKNLNFLPLEESLVHKSYLYKYQSLLDL
jgi:peptidoglycan/xylan/chitin deacetylase (PgdA/CDA1 family)